MALVEGLTDLQKFESMLQERTKDLLSLLDQGDFAGAMQILAELSDARNTVMYKEVGRLTRGLHEAIKQFNIDIEQSAAQASGSVSESMAANANERLNYVLELTENAANTTMDLVDASLPVAGELGEQAALLRQDWKSMADKESSLSELKDLGRSTEAFLQQIEDGSVVLHKNFTEILLAQGYQDLTGQMIKRVIGLVNDVESSLVNLVAVAGKVDRITGTKQDYEQLEADLQVDAEDQKLKGLGPQLNAEKSVDVMTGQDDVDDLLSSLGF